MYLISGFRRSGWGPIGLLEIWQWAISSCTNQAIAAGKSILVHCVNGRHRSTQVVATCLRPFHKSAEAAMDEVFG